MDRPFRSGRVVRASAVGKRPLPMNCPGHSVGPHAAPRCPLAPTGRPTHPRSAAAPCSFSWSASTTCSTTPAQPFDEKGSWTLSQATPHVPVRNVVEQLRDALADRYRIERELGRGGMATVYLAEDIKHKRRVAVKVLHTEHSAAVDKERFLREITTAANLVHPHIVPVFDSGEADGHLYLVMPLIEGESLRARLERDGPLDRKSTRLNSSHG